MDSNYIIRGETTTLKIKIGYEIGTGKETEIPLGHMIVTGLTNLSGKSTTLESLAKRAGVKVIAFRTKIGEDTFSNGTFLKPFFTENVDWYYVASILEATMSEKLKFERSWIIKASAGQNSLFGVYDKCKQLLSSSKESSLQNGVYTTLVAYFERVLPELQSIDLSDKLVLQPGINIMDLQHLSEQVQSLIIRSVLDYIQKNEKNTITCISESWKFMPQERGNPVKIAAEKYIRQGASRGNFLWMDSQDIAGVDKTILKQVSIWILGLQTERNEVKHTLDQIPISKKSRPKEEEITTLQRGHFFVCTPPKVTRVFVQPEWLDDTRAIKIAMGSLDVNDISKPVFIRPDSEIKQIQMPEPHRVDVKLEPLDIHPVEDIPRPLTKCEVHHPPTHDPKRDSSISIPEPLGFEGKIQPIAYDWIKEIQTRMDKLEKQGTINTEHIINEVLKRMPKGGSTTYTVAPIEALQKEWLEDTKNQVLQTIGGLTESAVTLLKYLEAVGKGVTANEVMEKCFFIKSGGSAQKKVNEATQELILANVCRKDTAGRRFGELKSRLSNMLSTHGASEQEVQAVYDHVIVDLLKNKGIMA